METTVSPEVRGDGVRRLVQPIARRWWVGLLQGLVTVAAGIVILGADWTLDQLAVVVGVVFIVHSAMHALGPAYPGQPRTWNLVVGLLGVAGGIAVLIWPHRSLDVIALLLACWLIAFGLVNAVAAIGVRRYSRYAWLLMLLGFIEVVIGASLLGHTEPTLAFAVAAVGVWAVMVGSLTTVLAVEIKRLPDRLARMT